MSGYEAYPEYRDSGVEWAGLIPVAWKTWKFKHVLNEKKKVCNVDAPAGSISFGRVVYKNSDSIPVETKASYQEILPGEYLINPLNMNFDLLSLRTALSDIQVVVSTGYIVLNASAGLVPRYVRWLLHEFDVAHMKTLGSGVRQTISFGDIGNSVFYEPPVSEQQAIANFLDHETAKIDILIEKQQQLIKLLKEKRQAVISHAVTKGLNPDAPMKDSGVEWLGEVPALWEVLPLRRQLDTIQQGNSPIANNQSPSKNEFGVLKISAVKKGSYVEDNSKTLRTEAEFEPRFEVKRGDLLVTRANTPELVADACFVSTEPTNRTMLCDLVYRLKVSKNALPAFLCYWLLSDLGRSQIEMDARGSSMTMAKVSQGHIRSWLATSPPLDQQQKIVDYLDKENDVFSSTEEKIRNALELLKERRTALISAAVTGKIDVRNWQAPESTLAPSMDA